MAAYVISEVETRDGAAMACYRELAAASIALFGGKYLVRGATADVAEGAPSQASMVIVEFPSMTRLRAWYASPEYAKALAFRQDALKRRLILRRACRSPSRHHPSSTILPREVPLSMSA